MGFRGARARARPGGSLEGLGLSFRRTVRAAPWSDAEDASRDGVPRDAADDASARVSRASSRLATRRRWLRDDPPGVRCTRAVLDGETAAGASDTGLEAAREAQAARLHRFYVDEPLPESGGTVYLDRDESRHAVRALRLKPGDALEVCDGRGGVMTAELVGMEGDGGRDAGVAAVASVGEVRRAPFAGPRWHVVVACGGLKGGRADWLVEKCAELGAASLVPLLTERSPTVGGAERDKSNKEKHGRGKGKGTSARRGNKQAAADDDDAVKTGREARWARVAAAASKQCLRAHALDVASPISFETLVTRVGDAPVTYLAAAGAPPLREVLAASVSVGARSEADGPSGGLLVVGPEGDFTDEEVAALVEAGARPVGLGPLRLRVETAAVAIASCVGTMHPGETPPGC